MVVPKAVTLDFHLAACLVESTESQRAALMVARSVDYSAVPMVGWRVLPWAEYWVEQTVVKLVALMVDSRAVSKVGMKAARLVAPRVVPWVVLWVDLSGHH